MYSIIAFFVYVFGACFASEVAPVDTSQFWNKEGAFVIYADVLDVKQETADRAGELLLRPIATLSGDFDSASSADISVSVAMGSVYYAIITTPAKGSKVVVLVKRVPAIPNSASTDVLRVPNAFVSCFPVAPEWKAKGIEGRPPLFEVTGFDDQKVKETIENLASFAASSARKPSKKPPSRRNRRRKSSRRNSRLNNHGWSHPTRSISVPSPPAKRSIFRAPRNKPSTAAS